MPSDISLMVNRQATDRIIHMALKSRPLENRLVQRSVLSGAWQIWSCPGGVDTLRLGMKGVYNAENKTTISTGVPAADH